MRCVNAQSSLSVLAAIVLLAPAITTPPASADTVWDVVDLSAAATEFTTEETLLATEAATYLTLNNVDTLLNATEGALRVTENATALTLEGVDTAVDAIGGVSWWPPGPGTAPQRALAHVPAIQAKTLSTANAGANLALGVNTDVLMAATGPAAVLTAGSIGNAAKFQSDGGRAATSLPYSAVGDGTVYASFVVDPTLELADVMSGVAWDSVIDPFTGIGNPAGSGQSGVSPDQVRGSPEPPSCGAGQFGYSVLMTQNKVDSGCAPFGVDTPTRATDATGNKIKLTYNPSLSGTTGTAVLKFTNVKNNAYAFKIRLRSSAPTGGTVDSVLSYGTAGTMAPSVDLNLAGVQWGLFSGSVTLAPRMQLTYSAPKSVDWAQITIWPNKGSNPTTWYSVQLGRFSGSTTNAYAPQAFSIDLTFAQRPETNGGDVRIVYQNGALTPLVVSWANNGNPLQVKADSIPSPTTVDLHFNNKMFNSVNHHAHVWGLIDIGQSRIGKLWLPTPGLDIQLRNVPSVPSVDYKQVLLAQNPHNEPPCDRAITDRLRYGTPGQTQICVTAKFAQANAQLWINGGKTQIWAVPANNEIRVAIGPATGIRYEEATTSGSYYWGGGASLQVKNDPAFPQLKSLDLVDVRSLLLIPGEHLGSGAGFLSGCSANDGNLDPLSGLTDTVAEASFGTLGQISTTINDRNNQLLLFVSLKNLQSLSNNGNILKLRFHSSGSGDLIYDPTNSCSKIDRVDLKVRSLKTVDIYHGGSGDVSWQPKIIALRNFKTAVGGSVTVDLQITESGCKNAWQAAVTVSRPSAQEYKTSVKLKLSCAPDLSGSGRHRLANDNDYGWSFKNPFTGKYQVNLDLNRDQT